MKVAPTNLIYLLPKFQIFLRPLTIFPELNPFCAFGKAEIKNPNIFSFLTDQTCYADLSPTYPLPPRGRNPSVSSPFPPSICHSYMDPGRQRYPFLFPNGRCQPLLLLP
jgi:hypothetical protein